MIVAVGIDLVECNRFEILARNATSSLRRLFHEIEMAYCLQEPNLSAQRFAARFAAKEAAYKAISSYDPSLKLSFKTLAPLLWIENNEFNHAPQLRIDWQQIGKPSPAQALIFMVSLSHTATHATAIVIATQP